MLKNNTRWKLNDYLQTIIQLQIILHQIIVKIPQTLQNIFLFFGTLQSVTFLLKPNYYVNNKSDGQADIIYLQMYVARPDLVVIDILSFIEYQYYSLFPILLVFAQELFVLTVQTFTYLLRENKNISIRQQLTVNATISSIFICIYSVCSQVFVVYLKIPLYILVTHQIIQASNDFDLAVLIVGVITLIFILIIDNFKEVICKATYNNKIEGFEVVEDQNLDLIIQFLKLMQIAVYLFTTSYEGPTQIQGILIVGISLIKIYQTIITINVIKQDFILIQIITQSISLTYVFCSIFNYQDLTLVISVLLMTLLNNQVKYTINRLIIDFQHIYNSPKIKIFITLYINSIIDQDDEVIKLHQLIAIGKHRLQCSRIKCFCKLNLAYFPQSIYKQLILKKLHQYNIESYNKSKQIVFSDILFYVASLHQLGFTVLAYQQTMESVNSEQFDGNIQKWVKNSAKDLQSSRTLKSNLSDSKRLKAQQTHDISKKLISYKKSNKTFLEEGRLNLLQSDISAQLIEDFMKKSDPQEVQISVAVNLFLQSELSQVTLKEQIIYIVQQKIQFLQLLLGAYTSTILYDKAKQITQNFVKVEDDLINQYEKFPSQKLQAVICFLQGEIFNNYLKAFKYANFTTIADEKLINMRKNMKLNLFSNKITYINVKLSDNLETLEIKSLSNNAHQFFGYQFEEFKKQQCLNFLIPDAVINEHGLMINQFVQTGSNQFFRNQNLNFFKLQNQFIKQFSMLFDINNYVLNGIHFAVFCEQIDQAAAHILLDINLLIAGISMNLFEKIGYKYKEISDNSQIILECYSVTIYQLIPNFNEVSKNSQKQYNLKMNLVDVLKQVTQPKRKNSCLKYWQIDKDINQYEATLSIHERQLYGLTYYILEIDDLRQKVKELKSQNFNMISLFRATNKNMVDMPNNHQISNSFSDLPSIHESMDEANIRPPQVVQMKPFIQEHEIQQQEQKSYNMYASIPSPVQSPNFDQNRLVNQAQGRFKVQQKFFNVQIQIDDTESIPLPQNLKLNIKEMSHDIDNNMRQFIQNQLYQDNENKFIDDQGSQVSSLAGVRKSAYFKKYDVIQETILRSKMPISFKYFITLIVSFILISSTYNTVILQQNSRDLNKFIQYVDMLSFNQYFIAPYGMFTSSRLIWAQLPTDYYFESFDESVFNVIYPWMQTTFESQFAAMRTNFQLQFQNAYLQEFFSDDYLRVFYQQTSYDNLTLVNITFKETLFQFLNYQYTYKIAYEQDRTIGNTPMQTYSWINYFILTNHFETLTQNILLYTQDAKDLIAKKWWTQSSIFISLACLILFFGYLFYLALLRNYSGYLEIFGYTDTQSILKDIDRYKIFLNLLSKDSDVMFKYVFELDVKEQFIQTNQTIQKQVPLNHKFAKNKISQQKHKLPQLKSLIGFTIIYALFFVFTFTITFQTQTYLQKYSQTTIFYKQLADLDTRVCGIYGDKLFANVILYFPFYNKSNLTDIQNRILQSTQIMSNFNALAQSIESKKYLFSSNFSSSFNAARTGSICSLLSPTDLVYAGQFCKTAFDGSLLLGLTSSLSFIINEVVTEYAVNQFENRIIGSNTYSVQGAYILSRVLETLIQQLKNSIVVSTNSQQTIVQSFCISYLVYAFVFMIVLKYFVIRYFSDEYYYTKRFVLLIPSQTLLLNDNLERQLRIYIARDAQ